MKKKSNDNNYKFHPYTLNLIHNWEKHFGKTATDKTTLMKYIQYFDYLLKFYYKFKFSDKDSLDSIVNEMNIESVCVKGILSKYY